MSIENMTETFELLEAKGSGDEIKIIRYRIGFTLNEITENHLGFVILDTPVPKTTSHEDLVELCNANIDSGMLEELRKNRYASLTNRKIMEESSETYVSNLPETPEPNPSNEIGVPKLYARLAVIEYDSNLWDQIKSYFDAPERTMSEKIFFEEATFWRKNDPIIQSVITEFGITKETLDALFSRAKEMRDEVLENK